MTTDTASFFNQGKPSDSMPMDRWDRYLLPDADGKTTGWTRVTTFADALANPYALSLWQQRMVALGIGRRPDLLALSSTIAGPEDKEPLADIVRQAHEAAGTHADANTGTALHDARKHHLKTGEINPLFAQELTAYERALREHGIRSNPEWTEKVCIVPEYHVAGRLDEIGLCADGKYRIVDTKTGKLEPYNHLKFTIQVAMYAHASAMWDEAAKRYVLMPPIERDYALIVHVRPGSDRAEVHRVNIGMGWVLARLCQEVRDARKMDGLITPAPIPPNSHLFSSNVPTQVVGGYTVPAPISAGAAITATFGAPIGSVVTHNAQPVMPLVDPAIDQPGATQRAADADQLQVEQGMTETEAFWWTHPDNDGSDEPSDPREQAGTPGDVRPPSQALKDSTPAGTVHVAADGTQRMYDGVRDWHVVHVAARQGPAAKTVRSTDAQDYHFGDLASQCEICNPGFETRTPSPPAEQPSPSFPKAGEVRFDETGTPHVFDGENWHQGHKCGGDYRIGDRDGCEYCPGPHREPAVTGSPEVRAQLNGLIANAEQLDAMVESFVKVAKTKARVQEVARAALAKMNLPETTIKLAQQQRKIARALIELAVERGHDLTEQLPGAFLHVEQRSTLADKAKASDDELRAQLSEQPSGMPPAPTTEPGATLHAENYAASIIARIKFATSVGELQQLRESVGPAWTDAMTEAARVRADELNAAAGEQPLSPLQQIEGATSTETIQRVWKTVTHDGADGQAWTDELQTAASARMAALGKGA
jgi:hypothetical protein